MERLDKSLHFLRISDNIFNPCEDNVSYYQLSSSHFVENRYQYTHLVSDIPFATFLSECPEVKSANAKFSGGCFENTG